MNHFEELDKLGRIGDEMYELSQAFAMTGNIIMAETLEELGEEIKAATKNILDCISADIHQRYQVTQQDSAKIVAACLAGIKIGKEYETTNPC